MQTPLRQEELVRRMHGFVTAELILQSDNLTIANHNLQWSYSASSRLLLSFIERIMRKVVDKRCLSNVAVSDQDSLGLVQCSTSGAGSELVI